MAVLVIFVSPVLAIATASILYAFLDVRMMYAIGLGWLFAVSVVVVLLLIKGEGQSEARQRRQIKRDMSALRAHYREQHSGPGDASDSPPEVVLRARALQNLLR